MPDGCLGEWRHQPDPQVVRLHHGCAGLTLKGEKIWYQAGTPLRPYGYPHNFVPNIAHQFILILQRARK